MLLKVKHLVPQYNTCGVYGFKEINGVVCVLGAPSQCRVSLYERTTGKKVGECVADKHGKYAFRGLTAANHFIIAHHPESTFNAVIQDNVVPK